MTVQKRPPFDVREARIEDAAGIAVVHVEAWREAYAGLLPHDYLDGLSVEARTGRWQSTIKAASHDVLVAEESHGVIIGFAAIEVPDSAEASRERVGELRAIYVAPEYWRQGTGTALADAATELLRARGCATAILWALDGNIGAQMFYLRHGWRRDGFRVTNNRDGIELPQARYSRAL